MCTGYLNAIITKLAGAATLALLLYSLKADADLVRNNDTVIMITVMIMLVLLMQMTAEGLSNLWWTPTDCSGTAMEILLSPITYDITPPTLAIIKVSGTTNTTLAQTDARRRLLHNSRRLQYFTLLPTSSSSQTYGANVIFSFSEAVSGFAEEYAFVSGGEISSAGLNETVTDQEYSATIIADNTKSALVMVTGSKFFFAWVLVFFFFFPLCLFFIVLTQGVTWANLLHAADLLYSPCVGLQQRSLHLVAAVLTCLLYIAVSTCLLDIIAPVTATLV